jgi:hypothetical protein
MSSLLSEIAARNPSSPARRVPVLASKRKTDPEKRVSGGFYLTPISETR